MKLRLSIPERSIAEASSEILSWEEDSYVCVEFVSADFGFWQPGDLRLTNTAGNQVGIRADKKTNGWGELLFSGTRHSIWNAPTLLAAFEAAGLICRTALPGGGHENVVSSIGRSADVLEYSSLRTDCPWWAVGLKHPRVEGVLKTLGDIGLTQDDISPFEGGTLDFISGELCWVDEWPARHGSKFTWPAVAYRRAAASGVSLT